MASSGHILTLSCPDKPGIVHAVTGIFAAKGHNVLDLQQFSDPVTNKFFMRVHFGPAPDVADASSTEHLEPDFQALATQYSMTYNFRPLKRRTRVLIMVSKIGHCLNDLLFRMKTGQLLIEVPIIVSNHPDFEALAKSYGIEFHHIPVTKDTKLEQEAKVLQLIKQHNIELVVLARYMQVLSPKLCEEMSGKIINSQLQPCRIVPFPCPYANIMIQSTTASCPASSAQSPTTRLTTAELRLSVPRRTLSQPISTKAPLSSNKSPESTTAWTPRS